MEYFVVSNNYIYDAWNNLDENSTNPLNFDVLDFSG